jgi:hypothetical protein
MSGLHVTRVSAACRSNPLPPPRSLPVSHHAGFMIPIGLGLITLHPVLDVEPPEIRTRYLYGHLPLITNHKRALNILNGECCSECSSSTSSSTPRPFQQHIIVTVVCIICPRTANSTVQYQWASEAPHVK